MNYMKLYLRVLKEKADSYQVCYPLWKVMKMQQVSLMFGEKKILQTPSETQGTCHLASPRPLGKS